MILKWNQSFQTTWPPCMPARWGTCIGYHHCARPIRATLHSPQKVDRLDFFLDWSSYYILKIHSDHNTGLNLYMFLFNNCTYYLWKRIKQNRLFEPMPGNLCPKCLETILLYLSFLWIRVYWHLLTIYKFTWFFQQVRVLERWQQLRDSEEICKASGQPLERVWTLLMDLRKKGWESWKQKEDESEKTTNKNEISWDHVDDIHHIIPWYHFHNRIHQTNSNIVPRFVLFFNGYHGRRLRFRFGQFQWSGPAGDTDGSFYMDAWNGKYGSLLKWCLQESSQTFLPGACDIKRIGPFLICYYFLEGTPKPFIGVYDTWCRRSICCSRSSKNVSTPLRRMERTWWLTVACVDAIPGVTFKELIAHANSIKQLRFLRLMINMTLHSDVYAMCRQQSWKSKLILKMVMFHATTTWLSMLCIVTLYLSKSHTGKT